MLKCWDADSHERPSFSALVFLISELLEPLADYLDFTAFSNATTEVVENEYTEIAPAGTTEAEQPVACSAYEVPVSHAISIPEDDRSSGEPYEVPTLHSVHVQHGDQVVMSGKN